MNRDDEVLLTLLAIDVDRYYEQLVTVYIHRLYTYAYWRTRRVQDAEDIVQETFLRVLSALRSYPTQRICSLSLRAWLYKITYHVTISYLSQHGSCMSLDAEEDEFEDIEDDQAELPELVVMMKERRSELELLVQTLPPKPREAIWLHYFGEMSYDEIADVLGHRTGTVRFHVHRGLGLLRRVLNIQRREVYG